MVKALSFKGDKKPPKKRKREAQEDDGDDAVSLSNKQQLVSVAAEAEDDENWVSADSVDDIAGPVILVLSCEPVACVAVDQLGRVFTSKIENMVENEPHSAEPHDVRQVWVSQKIVGSENSFTFKGHHGKYLGCDQYGILSSTREAVSSEETFKVVPAEGKPGQFEITTMRATYLSVDGDKSPAEVRGAAEEAGEMTSVRVRMQARFKPKHKTEKAEKVRAKISRKELEAEVGRRLEDDEVKKLKKARRQGNYHEAMLDVKVKGKHDKFA
ncbi:Putative actin-crosslinking, protein FRG1 [Septoria linicola]|uniref:Actin-crosslinking, protein FRG1 n=1 Tax=Septoria linicola TaxID=215465 RepID=A0A9Q9AYA1_9PEZI|nr:putative actin-crosslinking, protein FRG1 [Septoria linicola]USW53991.1 Putative actin-crosslinking, protein FRG1 [Septoria linicola]